MAAPTSASSSSSPEATDTKAAASTATASIATGAAQAATAKPDRKQNAKDPKKITLADSASHLARRAAVPAAGSGNSGPIAIAAEYIANYINVVRAQSRLANSAHSNAAGESRELTIRNLLSDHLPDTVRVTTGEIYDSLGNATNPMDIVITDASFPKLKPTRDSEILLIESITGVLEVKTTLDEETMSKAAGQLCAVRALESKPETVLTTSTSIAPMLGIAAWNLHRTIASGDDLQQRLLKIDPDGVVDVVMVFEEGIGLVRPRLFNSIVQFGANPERGYVRSIPVSSALCAVLWQLIPSPSILNARQVFLKYIAGGYPPVAADEVAAVEFLLKKSAEDTNFQEAAHQLVTAFLEKYPAHVQKSKFKHAQSQLYVQIQARKEKDKNKG